MEVEEYARIAAAEDEHWWYRNTRALMGDLLGPWLRPGGVFLDAGCGPGGNGAWMARHGAVVGVDRFMDALAFVRVGHPATVPVQASIARLPLVGGTFDAVACITVLTSVPDDAAAVREFARIVKPGGAVLLMEPAFPSLARGHDVIVHSLRRYRLPGLRSLAESAGLSIERASYAYSFLAPPAAALAAAWRIRPRPIDVAGSDVERTSFGRTFTALAAAERRWLTRRRVPFGTSAIVLATRPPGSEGVRTTSR